MPADAAVFGAGPAGPAAGARVELWEGAGHVR
jgi:hypothetical protein